MPRLLVSFMAVALVLVSGAAGAQGVHPAYPHVSDVHLDLSGASSDTDPQLWAITKAKLASILDVMNGLPTYDTSSGIEVEYGQ